MPRYNERLISELNMERDEPQYRARTGRLDKWRELVQQAQKELQLPISPPDRLMCLAYARFRLKPALV